MTTTAPFASVTPRTEADRETLRGPDGRPIKVLVVDDEQTLSELLSLALRYEGWDVPYGRRRRLGDRRRPGDAARTWWCWT